MDLEENNNYKPFLPIIKSQVKLGYNEVYKRLVYSLKTRLIYSLNFYFQVSGTQNKPFISIELDILVNFCK